MKGRRWLKALWLLPLIGLLLGLAIPQVDEFSAFAREGTAIDEHAFRVYSLEEIDTPGLRTALPPSLAPSTVGTRSRAWILPRSFPSVTKEMVSRHWANVGMASSSSESDGKTLFTMESRDYIGSDTGSRVIVLTSSKLPKGKCAVLVEQPSGLGAAWGRFVAGLRRGFR